MDIGTYVTFIIVKDSFGTDRGVDLYAVCDGKYRWGIHAREMDTTRELVFAAWLPQHKEKKCDEQWIDIKYACYLAEQRFYNDRIFRDKVLPLPKSEFPSK